MAVEGISEQELMATQARIVASARDAIYSTDLEGRILTWNNGAVALYGYEAGEVIGRPIEDLFNTRSIEQLKKAFTRLARGDQVARFVDERRRQDGSIVEVEVALSALIDGDRPIDIAFFERAVGEQRRALLAETNAKLALERTSHSDALGQLAGGIAHDFNNLLGVILNFATFVEDELDDPSAARADLAQIRTAATRAVELTRRLVLFANRGINRPEILDVNELLDLLHDHLRDAVVGQDVQLAMELAPQLPNVAIDRARLSEAITELVRNARQASLPGGEVRIETDVVEVDETYALANDRVIPGSYVRVKISDNGMGMSRADRERATEPFFTTRSRSEAAGLGLSMVLGIVNGAGGDFTIYSESGFGTTCRILLPIVEDAPRPKMPVSDTFQGSETVLFVEDEPALREITERVLARHGYTVLSCADGEEAIELASSYQGPIALLLTDVIMDPMPGNVVAERVRTLRPDISVCYISAYAESVLGSILSAGIAFIEKPFTERTLLTPIRQILDGRQ